NRAAPRLDRDPGRTGRRRPNALGDDVASAGPKTRGRADRGVVNSRQPAQVGVIVNPIAGMGGRVGLKGTDGEETLARARTLGAQPVAPGRAEDIAGALTSRGVDLTVVTPESAAGTRAAAADFRTAGVDLLLLVGGDG